MSKRNLDSINFILCWYCITNNLSGEKGGRGVGSERVKNGGETAMSVEGRERRKEKTREERKMRDSEGRRGKKIKIDEEVGG